MSLLSILRHGLATGGILLIIVGGACSAASQAGPSAPVASVTPPTDQAPPRDPGTSGLIADLDGHTLQVQGQSGQTAVTYDDKTKITKRVAGRADDVEAGLCAVVQPADGTAGDATTITATTVTLSKAGADGCGAGGREQSEGARPDRQGGSPPSARPSGAPMTMIATGEVESVTEGGFTMRAQRPDQDQPVEITVTTTDETTYQTTKETDTKSIKVGLCVLAMGEADDAGAVAATTLSLSPAVDGECTSGFMGRR